MFKPFIDFFLTGAEKDPSPNNYEKAQAALMSI
jgi:hypothetical protein